jgi:chromate reductase
MSALNLVCICGSLRAASYNAALVRALPELAPPELTFTSLDWSAVPVYNGDLEDAAFPQVVPELHAAIRASDGLIIATPEYNHGIPGGLKNLIDWLSRGVAPHAFSGVPVAILGASDGLIGTTRAQSALRQTLAALNAPTMPFPQVLVSRAQEKIDVTGQLHHDVTRKFIANWLVEVERWMRRFPRAER